MFLLTCMVLGIVGLEVTNAGALPSGNHFRIIGGIDAPEAYSPHMAVLIIAERFPTPLCGGSIISRRLVLTAAHCIDAVVLPNGQFVPSFHLRVGSNQWNSGGMVVQVETFHNHPQWDRDNIKYDVGILVMKKSLVLSDTVAVIQQNFDYIGGDEASLVTGWGRTGPREENNTINLQPTPINLQLLRVTTLTHEQCEQLMRRVAGHSWTPHIQKNVEICTLHSPGHGMCVGDSGSPLILQSTRQQIGIVSWGFGCAQGAPDVFVRMYGVRQFMETLMDVYRD